MIIPYLVSYLVEKEKEDFAPFESDDEKEKDEKKLMGLSGPTAILFVGLMLVFAIVNLLGIYYSLVCADKFWILLNVIGLIFGFPVGAVYFALTYNKKGHCFTNKVENMLESAKAE